MKKKASLKTLRNKADSLLTQIVKEKYPRCLLCNQETQVAHHFIKKSESSRLRYYLPNLIPLCNHCHLALHSHESLYSGRIIAIKGLDWFNDLEGKKREIIKVDRYFYEQHIENLKKTINNIPML